ncbi:MAG: cytochrome c [Alphaproteobacteria bacterium]|nr:cytochrome c [Alphaproteobacteria bacterium]
MSLNKVAILALSIAGLAGQALAADQTPIVSGEDEFLWNCAECHGFEGKGDGPLAKALIKPPADLTKIAERNVGVFPEDTIAAMIAGKESVMGHQSFQMPKFWERFERSEGQRGFDPAEVRIKAIVDYLKTIQAP